MFPATLEGTIVECSTALLRNIGLGSKWDIHSNLVFLNVISEEEMFYKIDFRAKCYRSFLAVIYEYS
jgi:hypothetical protein